MSIPKSQYNELIFLPYRLKTRPHRLQAHPNRCAVLAFDSGKELQQPRAMRREFFIVSLEIFLYIFHSASAMLKLFSAISPEVI